MELAKEHTTQEIQHTEVPIGEAHFKETSTHEIPIYAEPIFYIGDGNNPFPVTNSLITSWLSVFIIILFAFTIRFKLKKVPGRLQNIFEMILDGAFSVIDQVTNDRKISLKIFPFVFGIFFFVLINNWVGLLPFISAIGFTLVESGHSLFIPLFRAGTADINTTLSIAILTVVVANGFGVLVIGLWKLLNKYVNIKALSEIITKIRKDKMILIVAPIHFFVGFLEFIGELAKIASLSFRLFGNVFAGEVLLASMSAIFLYILPVPFLFLEIFVGLIQALIFSLLATVYFTIASQDHGEHEEEHHEVIENKELAKV